MIGARNASIRIPLSPWERLYVVMSTPWWLILPR